MIAVIFEVTPAEGRKDAYLDIAARLKPTLEQIKRGLSGNICRCGTYTNIFNAVLEASGQAPVMDAGGRA